METRTPTNVAYQLTVFFKGLTATEIDEAVEEAKRGVDAIKAIDRSDTYGQGISILTGIFKDLLPEEIDGFVSQAKAALGIKKYFRTDLDVPMLPDGDISFKTISSEEAAAFIRKGCESVADPKYPRRLKTVLRALEVSAGAKIEVDSVKLNPGDVCLVAQIGVTPTVFRLVEAKIPTV